MDPQEEPNAPANPYAASVVYAAKEPQRRMPLKLSLPLALVLVAIVGSVFFVSIGLGIGLLLVTAPAYFRAAFSSMQRTALGEQLTTAERIVSFLSSLAVVALCGIAGGVTFLGTCLLTLFTPVIEFGEQGFATILICASSLGFLVAFGIIYWTLWPKRRRS